MSKPKTKKLQRWIPGKATPSRRELFEPVYQEYGSDEGERRTERRIRKRKKQLAEFTARNTDRSQKNHPCHGRGCDFQHGGRGSRYAICQRCGDEIINS